MTKNAAVNFGYHCHSLAQIYNGKEIVETVAVIAKVDCRVFCHINCLGDKISNTAAPIQPNPFWFWEKSNYIYVSSLFLTPLFVLETKDFYCNFTANAPHVVGKEKIYA